jgi:hypothetical protein
MSEQGELTAELGKSLQKDFGGNNYSVYYDHGKAGAEGVGAISAYYGPKLTRDSKLAEIDIAVLDRKGKIILLVEVEENDDRPKTVIGDAMSTLFADRIAFKSKEQKFSNHGATLLVLAKDSKAGHKERMGEINKRIGQTLDNPKINRLKIKEVKLELFGKPDEMKGIILDGLQAYPSD